MNETDWQSLLDLVGDEIYNIVYAATGCGPFDGGCVVFARSLQRAFGGDVVVLIRADDTAEHASLHLDGMLLDFDGPLAPDAFIARFNANESARTVSWRLMSQNDLRDAPRGDEAEERIAAELARGLSTLDKPAAP